MNALIVSIKLITKYKRKIYNTKNDYNDYRVEVFLFCSRYSERLIRNCLIKFLVYTSQKMLTIFYIIFYKVFFIRAHWRKFSQIDHGLQEPTHSSPALPLTASFFTLRLAPLLYPSHSGLVSGLQVSQVYSLLRAFALTKGSWQFFLLPCYRMDRFSSHLSGLCSGEASF